jgi:hypothetical protein
LNPRRLEAAITRDAILSGEAVRERAPDNSAAPQNIELEQALLGAILVKTEAPP